MRGKCLQVVAQRCSGILKGQFRKSLNGARTHFASGTKFLFCTYLSHSVLHCCSQVSRFTVRHVFTGCRALRREDTIQADMWGDHICCQRHRRRHASNDSVMEIIFGAKKGLHIFRWTNKSLQVELQATTSMYQLFCWSQSSISWG